MATQQPISADFPFESRYIEVHGSKIHYVEEGAGDRDGQLRIRQIGQA